MIQIAKSDSQIKIVADSIAEAVTARYYPLMRTFEMRMRALEGASRP